MAVTDTPHINVWTYPNPTLNHITFMYAHINVCLFVRPHVRVRMHVGAYQVHKVVGVPKKLVPVHQLGEVVCCSVCMPAQKRWMSHKEGQGKTLVRSVRLHGLCTWRWENDDERWEGEVVVCVITWIGVSGESGEQYGGWEKDKLAYTPRGFRSELSIQRAITNPHTRTYGPLLLLASVLFQLSE